jgi:hypothetical protein
MVPYKKQTSTELDKKINYYFEKSFEMSDFDLEAMMMFARNLTEVITSKLYLDILNKEPCREKVFSLANGKKRTQKTLMASHYKIKDLEKSEKLPQSLLITLSMLSSAGNVSVHGSEILDSQLNAPFKDLIYFVCKWYYEKHKKEKTPKNIKYSVMSNTDDEKPFLLKEKINSSTFTDNFEFIDEKNKYFINASTSVNSSKEASISIKFTSENDSLTYSDRLYDGNIINLESDSTKLIIQIFNLKLTRHGARFGSVSGKVDLDLFQK